MVDQSTPSGSDILGAKGLSKADAGFGRFGGPGAETPLFWTSWSLVRENTKSKASHSSFSPLFTPCRSVRHGAP